MQLSERELALLSTLVYIDSVFTAKEGSNLKDLVSYLENRDDEYLTRRNLPKRLM